MAARLNTRLIIILLVALIGGAGVIGGFAYLRSRADATRHIRSGDESFAKGEYTQALSAYGRAVSKEPGNLAYVDKAFSALERVVPQTRSEVRERFSLYLQLLEKRVGIAPTNPQVHRDMIRVRHAIARLDGGDDAWKALVEVADRMVTSFEPPDAAHLEGVLYRAVGNLGRSRMLEPAAFDAAVADLEKVIAAHPDSDLARSTLIDALYDESSRRSLISRADTTAAALAARADALLTESIEKAPKGPLVAASALRVVLVRRNAGDASITADEILAAQDRVLENLPLATEPWEIDRVVEPLFAFAEVSRCKRAAEIIRTYLAAHPETIFPRQALMAALVFADEQREATKEALATLELPPSPVGVESLIQPELRAAAATALFDLAFARLQRATPEEQVAIRAEAGEALKRLRAEREEPDTDARVLRAEGRMATAMGRWSEALAKYEAYIRLVGETAAPADVLYEAGFAASKARELGLGRKRLAQAVTRSPGFFEAIILKAQVEQESGDLEKARRTLADARAMAPEDARVVALGGLLRSGDDETSRQLIAAQARLERGDLPGGRALLATVYAANPGEMRAIRSLAYVELLLGNPARAIELAKEGLVRMPEDDFLKKTIAIAETNDPVERIVRAVAVDVPEGPERTVRTLLSLAKTAQEQRNMMAAMEARDRADGAAAFRAVAEKLDAAAAEYRAQAESIQPIPPSVVLLDFEQALMRNDVDATQVIVDRELARTPGVLSAVELASMQARLLVSRSEANAVTNPAQRREQLTQAAAITSQALQKNPESTELLVVLGQVRRRLGDITGAVDAYESAYSQRPQDMRVVEMYADALQAAGEPQRLLQVLRDANRLRDASLIVRARWLEAEAVHGDRRIALLERRALQAAAPEDVANGGALAALLLTLAPSRELMLDNAGRDRYPDDRWRGLTSDQQRAAIEGLRKDFLDEAERVLKPLAEKNPRSYEVAALRADLARARGTPEVGEKVLRDAIAAVGQDAPATFHLSLGAYLTNIGKPADAQVAFTEAIKRQSERREADRYIGGTRAQRGDFVGALPHVRAVAEHTKAAADRLLYVEALGRTSQLAEAEAELASVIAAAGIDGESAMMEATLLSIRADEAIKDNGDVAGATEKLRLALRRAQELRPNDPAPRVGQAQVLLASWQRRPDRQASDRALDEALALVDEATRLRPDSWPASRVRAQIYNLRGDVTRARLEIERVLKLSPLNDEARQGLVELWLAARSSDKAVAVAREGVGLRPLDPRWHRIEGDLLSRMDDIPAAIAAHRKATDLEPGAAPDRLVMLMLTDTPTHKPEYTAVVKYIESRRDLIARSVYLHAAYAAALANSGRRPDGLEQLKSAYTAYRAQLGARPDLINGWYDQLWLVFGLDRTAEAEQFVRSLSTGELPPFDLREIALRWSETATDAGRSRAAELFQQAANAATDAAPNLQALILFDLGTGLYLAGRCPEAIQAYERGIKLDGNNPGTLNNLAYLYDSCLNDPTRALPHAERAVALAPGEASFHDTLGVVLGKLGETARAEEQLRAALAIARLPETHMHLAQLLARTNRTAEAKVELRKASEVDPKIRSSDEFKALEAQLGK